MKIFTLIFVMCFLNKALCQNTDLVQNPSLEGVPGSFSTLPEFWSRCQSLQNSSTPDLMPGLWNINLPPSDGLSYVNLVKRGPQNGSGSEIIATNLLRKMDTTKCYHLSFDIAFSEVFDVSAFGQFDFSDPANLLVAIAPYACTPTVDTLLFLTDLDVERNKWHTYSIYFKPRLDFRGLQFRALHKQIVDYGHIFLDNIRLKEYDSINFISKEQILIYQGDKVNIGIDSSGLYTYQWIGSNIPCWDCSQNQIDAYETNTYTLEVTNPEGCVYIYQYTIEVVPPIPPIPNVFTPNGDGINDHFYLDVKTQSNELVILNRWGNIVYNSINEELSWDGISNGEECSEGVYFYKILFTDILGKSHSFSGFVHLVRD